MPKARPISHCIRHHPFNESQSFEVILGIEALTASSKRLALDALDIKVYASTERAEIRGVIPLELPTTARTWGCLSNDAYKYLVPFSYYVKA